MNTDFQIGSWYMHGLIFFFIAYLEELHCGERGAMFLSNVNLNLDLILFIIENPK